MAKAFGCRPSSFYRGLSDLEAMTIDLHAMRHGGRAEQRANESAVRKMRTRRG